MKQVGKRLSCAALTAVLIAGGAMEGAAAVQIQNKPIYGAAAAQKAPQAYARELFKDSFDDGSNWQSILRRLSLRRDRHVFRAVVQITA